MQKATDDFVLPQKATDDFVLWQLYWGNLHYHTAVGYAQGSLRRSFEIAQEHLDFIAHTGHSQ